MVSIPAKYRAMVDQAAKTTGLPVAVVAAQINDESSFNPNAVSGAGAQGIAQFMPGTWASYGTGSPFNAANAFVAYAKYMGALLKQENGDVRKALAAYNAGPGNLAAGYGYADKILHDAGTGAITVGNPGGGAQNTLNPLGFPSEITSFFTDALKLFEAFFKPSTYIRIASGTFGVILLIAGLYVIGKEAFRG